MLLILRPVSLASVSTRRSRPVGSAWSAFSSSFRLAFIESNADAGFLDRARSELPSLWHQETLRRTGADTRRRAFVTAALASPDPAPQLGATRRDAAPDSPDRLDEVFVRALSRFARSEHGIAVTEYGLLVALIAVLLIGVVVIFGSSIASWFASRTSAITTS
jgi:Flp pilus assembly pilin Flp